MRSSDLADPIDVTVCAFDRDRAEVGGGRPDQHGRRREHLAGLVAPPTSDADLTAGVEVGAAGRLDTGVDAAVQPGGTGSGSPSMRRSNQARAAWAVAMSARSATSVACEFNCSPWRRLDGAVVTSRQPDVVGSRINPLSASSAGSRCRPAPELVGEITQGAPNCISAPTAARPGQRGLAARPRPVRWSSRGEVRVGLGDVRQPVASTGDVDAPMCGAHGPSVARRAVRPGPEVPVGPCTAACDASGRCALAERPAPASRSSP